MQVLCFYLKQDIEMDCFIGMDILIIGVLIMLDIAMDQRIIGPEVVEQVIQIDPMVVLSVSFKTTNS